MFFLIALLFIGCQQNKPNEEVTKPATEEVVSTHTDLLVDSVQNKSFVSDGGDKFLRFEIVVNKSVETVWQAFTTQRGAEGWMAPKVKFDLRLGGSITTFTPGIPEIVLNIPTYIPNELFIYKVNLVDGFPKAARSEDNNLQEVIQFEKLTNDQTRITATMMGWGKGESWDKTYAFFEKSNRLVYNDLVLNLNGGQVKWPDGK